MPARTQRMSRRSLAFACLSAILLGCGDETAPPPSGPADADPAVAALTAAPAFRSVSAGWDHTCGITTATRAFCWGFNSTGQLGTFDRIKRLTPTAVKGHLPFDAVDVGTGNSCGHTTADATWCWGQNLPNRTTNQPALVDDTRHLVQITVGSNHLCGITAGGQAWCRGANGSGQLGDGTTADRSSW